MTNNLKLWRKDFSFYNKGRVTAFYRILDNLGIRSNLWPEVYMVIVYADGQFCKSEIYDRHLESIKQ